ncbi:flavin-containing monooxygenase [Protofrankia coriariae]|uniref:flavin-containing monooxygenase n=1 Tax=Protofrankia coriariae TaxID=1562887 RepID=UPI0006403A05|nr:NAD(P)/FAD-dependent oxidoreductase [Protofrankia coriariae]
MPPQEAALPSSGVYPDLDVVVIGAGFSGLRMLYEARSRGLTARVLEAASDVGGTWYFNRYPGARTDSESWAYCFGFDKRLQEDWDWPERYPSQPQVLSYLRHVADRFDLRRDIQFDTRVRSAVFDEEHDVWVVTTERGERLVSRHLVSASGLLSVPYEPPFPRLSSFRGEWYMTARWPHEPVDFAGKRVAVIGTGASGVQLIPIVAATAARLTVFQRTANYILPARNYVLHDAQRQAIKANYDAIWEQVRRQAMGMPMNPANRVLGDVSPEEHQRILEAGWEEGGFRYFLETFDDIFVNPESNALAAEFVRNKIRTIVRDPATAELLCPKPDHPLGAKRPPLGHFYYETFNRDNVELVDVSGNAVDDITPTGVRLADGTEYEADVIVFAMGFDAMTGSLTSVDVRGRGGVTIAEKWRGGPRTHLALTVDEFPNFFMIAGPQIPFANAPVMIEPAAEWIGEAISYTREHGHTRIEPTAQAVTAYNEQCETFFNATVFPAGEKIRSWFVGANIPGKPHGVALYFGGYPNYIREVRQEAEEGFTHYRFSAVRDARPSVGVAGS